MIRLILISTLVFPITTDIEYFSNFIIWNVGQGSWSTYIEKSFCLHIDMGGERMNISPILKRCKKKKNIIYLTHLDWDHINKIKLFHKKSPQLCLTPHPELKKKSKASLWLKNIKLCENQAHPSIQVLHQPTKIKTPNQSSLIYSIKNKILIPGDSPTSEEKKWVYKIPKKIKVLILGHHGSKTSSSHLLLSSLKLNMAVASARKKRFGHPHKKIIQRLKKFKTPLLKTEDWGHIHFEI